WRRTASCGSATIQPPPSGSPACPWHSFLHLCLCAGPPSGCPDPSSISDAAVEHPHWQPPLPSKQHRRSSTVFVDSLFFPRSKNIQAVKASPSGKALNIIHRVGAKLSLKEVPMTRQRMIRSEISAGLL